MSAIFEFNEDNGAQTGSPLKGTTRNTAVTQMNWKNTDDVATAYSSSPITDGSNSYIKYQFGKFTGTFNQILNGKWSPHTSGTLGTGLALVGKVTSTYATPVTTAMAGSTSYTSIVAIGSGAAVSFSTTGPEAASPTSTLSAAGYTQYLATQLQTSGASAGDTATITGTLQYDEN